MCDWIEVDIIDLFIWMILQLYIYTKLSAWIGINMYIAWSMRFATFHK